ncbi:MAG: polyprenol monophosphomannose synthase [Desulfobacterales bacterium]|nr:polyprenol monophosphomannose synthase [Desulfobacterales bacterium]
MSEKIAICLPTYNEANNISLVIDDVLGVLPDAYILVIDDNSPDGTGKIAERIANGNPKISVLHRPKKEGLGPAYIDGFALVLSLKNIQLIVQMDADLSHPAKYLVDMIRASEKSDLVIGSRYVSGGSVQNWEIVRKMISRFGSFYARMWLKLPVSDLTSGFKIWNRNLLEKVIHHSITSNGYVFQIETTYAAYRLGATIKEIPFMFVNRNANKSKMTAEIAFEAIWRIPVIGLHGRQSPLIL